jgi:hypothetical protein
MVGSFLSQVLRDGKEASCQAAVARVVGHRQQMEESGPVPAIGSPKTWRSIPAAQLDDDVAVMRTQIADCEVAHRPGRLEPRVLKRRRQPWLRMSAMAQADGFRYNHPLYHARS